MYSWGGVNTLKNMCWLYLFPSLRFFLLGFPLQGFNEAIQRHLKIHKNTVLFFLRHWFLSQWVFPWQGFNEAYFFVSGHPRGSVVNYNGGSHKTTMSKKCATLGNFVEVSDGTHMFWMYAETETLWKFPWFKSLPINKVSEEWRNRDIEFVERLKSSSIQRSLVCVDDHLI